MVSKYKQFFKILSPSTGRITLSDDIDWSELYDISLKAGLGGVLYTKIKNSGLTQSECPEINDLKSVYDKYLFHNLKILHHFDLLNKKLSKAAIPFIPLKGIALINYYYDSPGFRVTSDIDLLFRRRDSERYLSYFGIKQELYQPAYFFSNYIYDKTDAKMVSEVSVEGVNIDLHEQLHAPSHPFKVNSKEIWSDAYKPSEGKTIHRMSSEHMLVYLVTHLYRHLRSHFIKQKPFKFIWFYDIAIVLNVEKNNLNEDKVLDIAKSWDCHEVLCCMIDAVAEAFDLHEAQVIREKAKRYETGRDEAKKALYYTFDPSDTDNSPDLSLKFWNPDKQTANASHHILYVLSYLFPSKAYLKSCYPSTYSGLIYTRYPQWILEKLGNKLFRSFK